MRVLIDTHLHIYPFQDAVASFESLIRRLAPLAPEDVRMACLTERFDCALFEELSASDDRIRPRYSASKTDSDKVLRIERNDGEWFYLNAGQQIVTAENIEILGLNMRTRVKEGREAGETIRAVLAEGGYPVVAWAPGKWFGKRGKLVQSLVRSFNPAEIALGDTSLRPLGWTTPFIIRAARKQGFRVLAGSDPLPFAGEEVRPGSYHSAIEWPEDDFAPSDLFARLAASAAEIRIENRPRRPGILTVAQRMIQHKRAG